MQTCLFWQPTPRSLGRRLRAHRAPRTKAAVAAGRRLLLVCRRVRPMALVAVHGAVHGAARSVPHAQSALLAHYVVGWSLRANECPAGKRTAAATECLAAVQEAARQAGLEEVRGLKEVDAGSEFQVPPGCSYSRVSKKSIFNRNPMGGRGASYPLVCASESGGPRRRSLSGAVRELRAPAGRE